MDLPIYLLTMGAQVHMPYQLEYEMRTKNWNSILLMCILVLGHV